MKDEEIIYSEGSPVEEQINNKEAPDIVRDENSITDHFETTPFSEDDLVEPEMTYVTSTEDGEALPTKDVNKKLHEDLKICRQEKEEYLTGWQRAKADYINLQKELDSTRLNISINSREKMARNLMPALDSFDMAFANKEAWGKVDKDWRTGVEYIYTQLLNGLSDSGVEKIDKIDVPFDPNLHESIEMVLADKEEQDHKIANIVQVGYKIGERIIRPARVNVYEFKK